MLLACLLGAACGDAAQPPDLALGAELYEERCVHCHDGRVVRAPSHEALNGLPAAATLATLEAGVMRTHAEGMNAHERRSVAAYLGGPAEESPEWGACTAAESVPVGLDAAPLASGWSVDPAGTRFQPFARAGFGADRVAGLRVAWAFAFPGASKARSLPAVVGDTVFTGSADGTVYALARRSGCVRWRFRADSEVRTSISVGRARPDGELQVFFGDFGAQLYSLDARTGFLIWKTRVHPHPYATATGSPRLHEGRLYVPVSSYEITVAMNPRYSCCTFRGAVVALEARDGREIWRTHTVEAPVPQGLNAFLARKHGPSGAPVWTTPAIDARRGTLYVGTGENYSSPASATSDAIFAIALADGAVRWVRQTTARDAYTMACHVPGGVNCPDEDGPDFDYGASPLLVDLGDGRGIVVAAQKSGIAHGIDPDSGALVWTRRVGRGGTLGGVHWGIAAEGRRVYIPVSDRDDQRSYPHPEQPGLVALDAADGSVLWRVQAPNACVGREGCYPGFSAAPAALTGVVLVGGLDGHLRAYAGESGELLLDFDSARAYPDAVGGTGRGGAIDGPGPLVAGGRVYLNSGYGQFGQMPGNVLLALEPGSGS